MTIHQFLLILRARYLVAVITLLVTAAAVTGFSLISPKEYAASASVVVDAKAADLLTGTSMPAAVSTGVMATQVDIIRSTRVAKEVVKIMGLENNNEMISMWFKTTQGKGEFADWAAASFQRNLDILPSRESSVINITYTAPDPAYAATVANAFAQGYINVNLGLRVAPAKQYALFFELQTKAARAKLEATQKALSDYQQTNGITTVDERLDYETAKLNEVSSQLTMLQGVGTENTSKRLNSSGMDTTSDVMQNPVVNNIKVDIAREEARLEDLSTIYGTAHPSYIRSQATLASLRAKLQVETRRVGSSIDTAFNVNKQREKQLFDSLSVQKDKVLKLNQQRDELNVLRRDVESAQRAYDLVTQRAMQTSIEGQVNQTNVSILNAATAPTSASKPRVLFNAMVGVFLGTLMGVGLALIMELLNRKIRSMQDLEDVLEMPVLGNVSSATRMLSLSRKGAAA